MANLEIIDRQILTARKGEIRFITLKVAKLNFILRPMSNIMLRRFKEATFRGAFGKVFRRLVCAFPHQEKCQECLLFKKCVFSIIFSPGATEGDNFLKKFESVPRPFTIQIKNTKDIISTEDELKVQFVLIGKAMEYYPYVFLTIKELGNEGFGIRNKEGIRGKYEIKEVIEILPDGTERNIFNCKNPNAWLPLKGFHLKDVIEEAEVKACEIKFETPVRLKQNGRIVQFIDFRLLIRSIITRFNALSYFYGNHLPEIDIKKLLDEAEKVNVNKCSTEFVDFNWHSSHQKTHIMLGGLIGKMGYRGNISPFYPYLKIAEVIGVGKNTTFGFGRIKVQI